MLQSRWSIQLKPGFAIFAEVLTPQESREFRPKDLALVHPGFRLVEPTARREGWYGWLRFPVVFRCQVSATEFDPLFRCRSWNGLSFTGVGLQLQAIQCSGFRVRYLL